MSVALTITYSINQVFPKTVVPTAPAGPSTDSDTVGFSNGGWATTAQRADGFSDIVFYDAAGTVLSVDPTFHAARATQLTNGNVVSAGTAVGGGIGFHIDTSTGAFVTSGSITPTTAETNADVAALRGGG